MLLDNIQTCSDIDQSHMIDILVKFPEYIQQAINIVDSLSLPKIYNIHTIIFSGFGGSIVSGDIIQSYLRSRFSIPIIINRSLDLPGWVRKNTLVFLQNYSGDEEETILSFRNAIEKNATIIGISSGGKLQEFCESRSLPHIPIPTGLKARSALPFFLFSCLSSLEKIGLLSFDQQAAYHDSIEIAKDTINHIHPSVPLEKNISKQMANTIYDTIPQLYTYGMFESIARRWSSQFNETSKIPSNFKSIPECIHNDILGWADAPSLSNLNTAIFFRDKSVEHPSIRKKIDFMKELFTSINTPFMDVNIIGKKDLEKFVYLLLVGDFTSYYLALLRKVDPGSISAAQSLQKERFH